LSGGTPSYDNIKRHFNRLGFRLDLHAVHAVGPRRITDLGHMNAWRNGIMRAEFLRIMGAAPW